MRWRGIGLTDQGKKRKTNEDSFLVDDDVGLYIVSDGMGGHAAGEVASAEAVRAAARFVSTQKKDELDRDAAVTIVKGAVQRACGVVYHLARSDVRKAGMGCTITLALVCGDFAAVGHVGDCRAYLWRAGVATQITTDHTVGAEMRAAGLPDVEQIIERYANVLSRSLGSQEAVAVDAFVLDLVAGDQLLLCSDGLTEYIPSVEWLAGELVGDTLDANVESLIDHANESGGRDNITTVLVAMEAGPDEHANAERRRVRVAGQLDALGNVFLFEHLSLGVLSRLLSHCDVRRCKKGEVHIAQGTRCDQLMVVTRGTFELRRDGRTVGTLSPGDHTGVTTLLKPRPARASVVAGDGAVVLTLRRDAFWDLVKQKPRLGVNMLERLVTKLSGRLDESIARRDDGDEETSPLSSPDRL